MELERLPAERPVGNRGAMQAVRDSFDDIALLREHGLSWADIATLLAENGVVTRDGSAIPSITVRSAFFMVGNEIKAGQTVDEGGEPPADVIAAIHAATLARIAPPEEPQQDEAPESPEPEPEAVVEVPPVAAVDAEEAAPEPAAVPETPPEALPEAPMAAEPPAIAAIVPSDTWLLPAEPTTPVAEPEPQPVESVPEEPPVDAAPPREQECPAPHSDSPSEPVKGHHMLGTIFVLNDRGGVGKTLLSHHLMATAMLEGLQLRIVEYEVNERLARLYGPDVVEHRRITQDFMNMMGSGDGFYEFWDQIGPELQRGGRLFDFGGNISQWFFNWAEVSGFDYYVGQGERLTFMVPVTVDLASLSTGMATLDRIAVIAPKAKRVLVENGVSGPFTQLEESQYGRRKAEMVEREGVEVIQMPPCTAPAWARLTGHRLDQVAQMTREDLVKLGMTPPVASRSLIIIHEWLRLMRTSLSPYLHDAFRNTAGAAAAAKGGRGAD